MVVLVEESPVETPTLFARFLTGGEHLQNQKLDELLQFMAHTDVSDLCSTRQYRTELWQLILRCTDLRDTVWEERCDCRGAQIRLSNLELERLIKGGLHLAAKWRHSVDEMDAQLSKLTRRDGEGAYAYGSVGPWAEETLILARRMGQERGTFRVHPHLFEAVLQTVES